MLDPGRYFAEAIYFIQYTLAQLLWAVNRALLAIAVITDSVNAWLLANVGYFVQLLVNALSAPLGGMLILALTALGFWYALNNIVPTQRWVDPSKLFTYGLIALFFFSSPLVAIGMMEQLRLALSGGIDPTLLDAAAGDIFAGGMDGTDSGLPAAVPDVNADGVLGSFDLVAAFMHAATLDELDSYEFPVDFEADYFPYGDPSTINLSDEADREEAKALASAGIERLLFALVAVPTAIAEHFLRLALTSVAVFLYAGVPFAMLLAFFVTTQAFLGAYLRQFINLLIETFFSVVIVAIVIAMLAAAAQQGVGLFIGASLIATLIIGWRILSALKLAAAAFNLFGGGLLTGGAGGMEAVSLGRRAVGGAVGLAGAALTGGATMALGGAALATAAAVRADAGAGGRYLDPDKADGRVQQLQTIAGYGLGRNDAVRRVIEGTHEVRMLTRNFRDGAAQPYAPDTLDYLRAGSSMSNFGSSPWLAMRLSPSLRAAYDQIGGTPGGGSGHPLDTMRDEDGAPVRETPAADGQVRDNRSNRTASSPTPVNRSSATLSAAPTPSAAPMSSSTPTSSAALMPSSAPMSSSTPAPQADIAPVAPPSAPPLPMDDELPRQPDFPPSVDRYHLEPDSPDRRQTLTETLARLEEPASLPGQAAQRLLNTYAGPTNAAAIQTAVDQHGAATVQAATAALTDLIADYRAAGQNARAILSAFQTGEAFDRLRAAEDTPLTDNQLTALADLVLLPQRRISRSELAQVIGDQVAAGNLSDRAIATAIGSPVGFGGQTGTLRAVMTGVQALRLSTEELAQLTDLLRDGRRREAEALINARGQRPEQAATFVADLAALPSVLVVPQTTGTPIPAPRMPINDPETHDE